MLAQRIDIDLRPIGLRIGLKNPDNLLSRGERPLSGLAGTEPPP
jgi:hypothetical protein